MLKKKQPPLKIGFDRQSQNINVIHVYPHFTGNFNDDISKWNTSQVTNMTGMFSKAYSFNQPIATWNTSQVTDMFGMFNGAYSYEHVVKPIYSESGCVRWRLGIDCSW